MTLLRFTCGTGLAGWAVRAATWSPFAHVGFRLDDGTILDAYPGRGVSLRREADPPGVEYFRVDVPAPVLAAAVRWGADTQRLGCPYDWRGIAGFAVRRDWHDPGAWFCSEFIAAAFEGAGFPLLRADHLDRVTPRDLLLSPYLRPATAP